MKIRNGHVTNSSSSSFVLSINIALKNGDSIYFEGNGGSPECGRTDYFDYDAVAKVSPKELATSRTVDSMIKKLTNGIVDRDLWSETETKIFEKSNPFKNDYDDKEFDAYRLIEEIKEKVHSMDDIDYISISGNEYNYMNYLQEYTYHRDTKEYVGTVDGCDFEKDGSTGGYLEFNIEGCNIEYTNEEGRYRIMKKRIGFVTNSSSSSFVLFKIQSHILAQLLEPFQEEIMDEFYGMCSCVEDIVEITGDESAYVEMPYGDKTPGGIIDTLAAFLDCEFADSGMRYLGDGKPLDYENQEEDLGDLENFSEITQVLMNNKEEIINDMGSAEIEYSDYGWEGDSDVRYEQGWYDEDYLEELLNQIAEKNGCKKEEVTNDMFSEYVSDKMSVEKQTLTYDKETGNFEMKESKRLADMDW